MGNYWSTTTTKRTYGWKRDSSCEGDKYHMFAIHQNQDQIKKVDLSQFCPPVYNQSTLGSCTGNAIACAYEIDEIKQGEKEPFVPSRLFIYYNEREMEGHVEEDSGAEIKDGIKSIHDVGVCPETMWPYDITKFREKPSAECYTEAKNHQSVEYKRVEQNIQQIKQCLIEGFPFVFGFMVYESFESEEVAKTGIVPMPKADERLLGGHAVVCIGFSDDTQKILVRNSWGPEWGIQEPASLKGCFWMDYNYIIDTNLASDLWTVRRVRDGNSTVDLSPVIPQMITSTATVETQSTLLSTDNMFSVLSEDNNSKLKDEWKRSKRRHQRKRKQS